MYGPADGAAPSHRRLVLTLDKFDTATAATSHLVTKVTRLAASHIVAVKEVRSKL